MRSARFPVEIDEEVQRIAAEQFKGNMSNAISALVEKALGMNTQALSGLSPRDRAVNAELREVKQQAQNAIAEALNDLWRQP